MIKIDSFLTESKQGFIRRISRVASSTHYLRTLKLTYHMKKYLLTKNYLLIKKLSFQTFTWTFLVSLDLILCSQIGWFTFSLKYFPIMQCYECFLSCWLWMFTFTNANVSMIQQLFQRMAELANTKHHWLGLSNFSLLAITININIFPI